MTSAAESNSTLPSSDSGTNGWEQILHVVSVGFIAALVIAGLTGVLGVRTSSAIASGDGLEIEVTHAAVTRPGLATPFDVVVRSVDGSPLPEQLTTRIDAGYLSMFDENGLDPSPSASFQSERWIWWTFDVPSGQTEFQLSFDARLEPGVQWGRRGSVALVDGNREVVAAFRTWVIP